MTSALTMGDARTAYAQGRRAPTIIRDTEIENILKEWIKPVIKRAELDPAVINIILVQDRALNAFVAGGPNIFIYTGLIEKSESPDEVIGVLAHELGHISGGHLVRARGAMENASYESILGTILGLGAAIISGNGGVGAAVAAGTQSAAMSNYLAFSRVQESSADQAALSYLDKAQMSAGGLLSFMKKLEAQELLPASQQSEYIRTHPLTQNRISALKKGYESSSYREKDLPASWIEQHKRMKAKLTGFITPEQVAWNYGDRDQSVAAGYARSIAAYRQNHIEKAIDGINRLLAREPNNAYFLELKGQMLFEFGHVEESLAPYEKAIALLNDAPLIRTAYAHALIESSHKSTARLDKAIKQLERAVRDESRSPRNYRLLATAYGRKGDEAAAKLYLAEEALLKKQTDYARKQATAALTELDPQSSQGIRAQDILSIIEQSEKNR